MNICIFGRRLILRLRWYINWRVWLKMCRYIWSRSRTHFCSKQVKRSVINTQIKQTCPGGHKDNIWLSNKMVVLYMVALKPVAFLHVHTFESFFFEQQSTDYILLENAHISDSEIHFDAPIYFVKISENWKSETLN